MTRQSDCADPNVNTPVRNTTLTALQALSLLNNPLASGGIAKVELNNNGVTQEVDFSRPVLKHLSSTNVAANGTHNDIAFDASKLRIAFAEIR